jgi:hypothetical protein
MSCSLNRKLSTKASEYENKEYTDIQNMTVHLLSCLGWLSVLILLFWLTLTSIKFVFTWFKLAVSNDLCFSQLLLIQWYEPCHIQV